MGEESASKLTHMAAARDAICFPRGLLCRAVHDMVAGFPRVSHLRKRGNGVGVRAAVLL